MAGSSESDPSTYVAPIELLGLNFLGPNTFTGLSDSLTNLLTALAERAEVKVRRVQEDGAKCLVFNDKYTVRGDLLVEFIDYMEAKTAKDKEEVEELNNQEREIEQELEMLHGQLIQKQQLAAEAESNLQFWSEMARLMNEMLRR